MARIYLNTEAGEEVVIETTNLDHTEGVDPLGGVYYRKWLAVEKRYHESMWVSEPDKTVWKEP